MTHEKFGPYVIHETLGRGGMGTVYVGVDERTGDRAAIKVLHGGAGRGGARERFEREIETLKTLKHPHIVRLFGYGEEPAGMFYAMELVDGNSLSELIQRKRDYTWREAFEIGLAIAQGLKHAHDFGVIHRDVKPANILIDKEGNVKISDFGIARLFGATGVTADGGIIGTADFMAPEQAFGEPVSPRSDLYSLGAVIYAMLAKQPPFRAKTVTEALDKLRNSEPPPIDRLCDGVPEEAADIIHRLLEKHPRDRFPTATTVIRRIEALLESEIPDEAAFRIESAVIETQTPDLLDDYRLKRDASESAQIIADDETRIAPESAAPEPPPPIGQTKHFTTVAQDSKSGRYFTHNVEPVSSWRNHIQTGLIALALVVIVVLIFWLPRAPSADAMYEQLAASVDNGQLDEAGDELDQFIAIYPDDPRVEEVKSWKEELSLDRRERRYRLTMQLRQKTETFDAIEIAYIDALRQIDSAPEEAAAKMRALLAVYGPPDRITGDASRCLTLAARRLVQLDKQLAETSSKQLAEIGARMAAANQMAADEPNKARQIYQGLIDLYGDKPWAWEQMEQAQQALSETPASVPVEEQPAPESEQAPPEEAAAPESETETPAEPKSP
ncbi:serine/threonine-protein kinase [Blastopirellula marina]|uniref:Probable serine/threonine-protein kinase pknA n=1 Tax=Blastopirellula marina DSM 3645 TaxID=314230 RepID=A3ZWN5_9BACT|nr:serine/threonine-protein kinase [Blastopirellula marina]EAQ79009.1 probable serine/threonine-protein kinase pknA [Blastopirellula marina DSM 3645]